MSPIVNNVDIILQMRRRERINIYKLRGGQKYGGDNIEPCGITVILMYQPRELHQMVQQYPVVIIHFVCMRYLVADRLTYLNSAFLGITN